MNKTLTFLICAIGLATPAMADEVNLEEYGNPATISINSGSAVIEGQTITLIDVSPLAALSAGMHVHNGRVFQAFPVRELAAAWNSCNAMKFENELFHEDGVNAIIVFSSGASEHGHLTTAPLVTATEEFSHTTGGDEGVLRVMLTELENLDDGNIQFRIEGDEIYDGEYQDVSILTECFGLPGTL
jgi:hypothetical protein